MRKCAGNVAVAGLIGVDLLDDRLRDWRSSRRQRPVAYTDTRGTTTPHAIRHDFDLVGYCVLGAFVVCICSRDLAVCGFVVYPLDTCDGNG